MQRPPRDYSIAAMRRVVTPATLSSSLPPIVEELTEDITKLERAYVY